MSTTKWHLAYRSGEKQYNPPKEGMYWVTDGYFVFMGYYHPTEGWGIFDRTKCIIQDDWNFDIRYWREVRIPEITEKIKRD